MNMLIDIITIVGAILIMIGVAMFSLPAGLIAAGALCLLIAFLLSGREEDEEQ